MFRDTNDLAYGRSTSLSLFRRAKGNLSFVQRLKLEAKLPVHNGCVNTMCWNDSGSLILSGSDDQHLKITDPFNRNVVSSVHSGHRANIFSAKFLPNSRDSQIVSCSGDGMIFHTDIERTDATGSHLFNCHFGTTYEVLTIPQDCHTFLSCGEDGTVRWFDLRIKSGCSREDCKEDVLINCSRAVTSLAINPCTPYELAVGCSDSTVRIFDRRLLGTVATGNFSGRSITGMMSRFNAPALENRSHRITSLVYSRDGEELLTNYSSEHLYLFNLKMDGRKLKEFTTDVKDPGTEETSSGPTGSHQPPVKRLRLRGDWSDTGPGARPERERADQEDQAAMTVMQRMSDMLSRWLEGASRQAHRMTEGSMVEQATASTSEADQATLSRQSTATQSASTTAASAQNDGQEPSTSQDPDCSWAPSRSISNQTNEMKHGSDDVSSTAVTRLGSQRGATLSGTAVGPSGAGAREMVCRLAKQLTCGIDSAAEGMEDNVETDDSSKVNKTEVIATSSTVNSEGAGDLRECDIEHNTVVTSESVSFDNMTSSDDISLDDNVSDSEKKVSPSRDADKPASRHSELGCVKSTDLMADDTTDCGLSTNKPPLTPSDVTIDWTNSESECRDSAAAVTDNIRTDANLDAINVTEVNTSMSNVTEDMLTVGVTNSLLTTNAVDQDQTEGNVVSGSSSGNESSHVQEHQASNVASISRMIEPSPPDLQPVISLHYCTQGTSSSTIRIDFEALTERQHLVMDDRLRTYVETSSESATSYTTASTDPPQGVATSQSQSAPDIAVAGEPASNANVGLNMSTGSSDSDMSVSSVGGHDPLETTDDKGGRIQKRPHKQLASDSSSSDDQEKLGMSCSPDGHNQPSTSANVPPDNHNQPSTSANVPLDGHNQPSTSANVPPDGHNQPSTSANVPPESQHSDEVTGSMSAQASVQVTDDTMRTSTSSDNPSPGQTSEENHGRRSSLPTSTRLDTQGQQQETHPVHSNPSSGLARLFGSVDDDDDDDDVDDGRLMGGARNRQSRSHTRDNEAERNRAASHLQRLYRQRQAARDRDEVEMKKLPQPVVMKVFKGHRNSRTMIKQANFWGDDYVMCGSDCGHIFVWDRTTARLAMLLEADKHVVNCVQPHPYDPILASSGIDYDIKIWSPLSSEACFDEQAAEEIMRRNDVMLEETRDTITVPASFMLRMLASLNHFRGARGPRPRHIPSDASSSSDEG